MKNARGPRGLAALLLVQILGIAPHRAQHARWGPRSSLVAPLCRGPHGADCAPWGGTSGRIAALGATLDSHHGLLDARQPRGDPETGGRAPGVVRGDQLPPARMIERASERAPTQVN